MKFDISTQQSTRFASSYEFIDLSVGQDQLLYGLQNQSVVRVYDPASLSELRSIALSKGVRGITANKSGELFGASWDGNVYRFNANGQVLASFNPGLGSLMDIDLANDGRLAVGTRLEGAFLVDQDLTQAIAIYDVSKHNVFVAFTDNAESDDQPDTNPPVELSIKDVTASSSYYSSYYGPKNLIDGTSSFWVGGINAAPWVLEFEIPASRLDRLELEVYYRYGGLVNVEVSGDGMTYSPVLQNIPLNGTTQSPYREINVLPLAGMKEGTRYVRVTITDNAYSVFPVLTEARLYGWQN